MFFWINSKVFNIYKTNVKGYSKSGLVGNRYNLVGWEEYNIFVVKNFTATFDFCGAKKQKIILELFQLLNIDLKLFIV